MNILVLTNCSWDERGSVGNTLSNWFGGWGNVHFSNLYSREEKPNNKCCESYFQVSPTMILRHFFNPWRIGVEFVNGNFTEEKPSIESLLIDSTRGKKSRRFFQFFAELLYSSKIWFNKRVKAYINKHNPDLCFCFAISDPFRYDLCRYLKKLACPIVMYIADDVYGSYVKQSSFVSKRYKRRFESMVLMADKVYGASEMMCERYSSLFGIDVSPLYKGCVLSPPKLRINKPIRIAYAGNLYYGRGQTLASLAGVIGQINKDKNISIQLEIYTGSPVSVGLNNALNIEGSSRIVGQKPYSEIVEILKSVDVVLHVESFDLEQIEKVKYSFSTKIIDCLQSGAVMMVVGPKGIASVEYPRSIPGTIVIDNLNEIATTLAAIMDNPHQLLEKAASIHSFAEHTFPIEIVRGRLWSDFVGIVNHPKTMV